MRLTVTGYPLPEPLVIELQGDDDQRETAHPDAPSVSREVAEAIVTAWAEAPGESDVLRGGEYLPEADMWITALFMEGEFTFSQWPARDGRFPLASCPFRGMFEFDLTIDDEE